MKESPICSMNTVCSTVLLPLSVGKEMLSMKTEAQVLNRPFLGRTFTHRMFSIQSGAKVPQISCSACSRIRWQI